MLLHALALSLITLVPPAVGAGECVVIAPLAGPETAFGGDDCSHRTLPASTFKIPHALDRAADTGRHRQERGPLGRREA